MSLVPEHCHHFLGHVLRVTALQTQSLQVAIQARREMIEQLHEGLSVPPLGHTSGQSGELLLLTIAHADRTAPKPVDFGADLADKLRMLANSRNRLFPKSY